MAIDFAKVWGAKNRLSKASHPIRVGLREQHLPRAVLRDELASIALEEAILLSRGHFHRERPARFSAGGVLSGVGGRGRLSGILIEYCLGNAQRFLHRMA